MSANQPKIKCNDFQNDSELISYYDKWAKTYDQDVVAERGYVGPEVGACTLNEFLEKNNFDKNSKIIDVGAGTGLVGEHLNKMNYTYLDALEPSKVSNEVARGKNIYQNIFEFCMEPGKEMPIPSNSYAASIAIGVFTKGHFIGENNAMEEMIRVVKPGGLVCFSIREDIMLDKAYHHGDKMKAFCDNNTWKELLNAKRPYHVSPTCNQTCNMYVYQVL